MNKTGDTLKLYIDQIGFGNKVGLETFQVVHRSNMEITGSGLEYQHRFD